MKLKIDAEFSDYSGGIAYAFSISENIDDINAFRLFILDKINQNEIDCNQLFCRMTPDIATKNVITPVSCELTSGLTQQLISTPIGTHNTVFIYAIDFQKNKTIIPYKFNPVTQK